MSSISMPRALLMNFLGKAPNWYKLTIVAFLLLNPLVVALFGTEAAGWLLLGEFIFTLAMALKCYPLQPGGLLAIEAVLIGLTSPEQVMHEITHNIEVLLLLMFMVAGIYFLKDLLLFIFSRIILRVRSKVALSLVFCIAAAFLSAFLDALTVTAVVIAVCTGFYGIYHRVASGKSYKQELIHDSGDDSSVEDLHRIDLDNFRAFLRSLLMHASIGTALGGVCTLVGEPQNLLIASQASWQFGEFLLRMAPVTLPVFFVGLLTCVLVEKSRMFGYGAQLPDPVRHIMERFAEHEDAKRTTRDRAALVVQAIAAVWLIVGLALHLASVGLIGLTVIVIATAFCGIIEEHRIGNAFHEALPFTALLAVFFAIVAIISEQHLFTPLVEYVLTFEGREQASAFYLANGALSAVSDNVFVASIYIKEVSRAFADGEITRDAFDMLAVAINTGTNIPSVATPNGQAAFLFLLTSAIAPLVRLSYGKMVVMALPYTIAMTLTGLIMVQLALVPATDALYENGWLQHHNAEHLEGIPSDDDTQH